MLYSLRNYEIKWWERLRNTTFDAKAVTYNLRKPIKQFYTMDEVIEDLDPQTELERKQRAPYRYFFYVTLADGIEYILYLPMHGATWINNLYHWISYRTFDKYHIIKLDLYPTYHEVDTRLNAALWKLLVDFVEIEAAHHNIIFDDNYKNLKKEFVKGRSRKHGLAYLDFHIGQTDYTPVKIKLKQKIKFAYLYYKDVRPKLEQEIEVLQEEINKDYKSLSRTERTKRYRVLWKKEEQLYNQDTKHLKYIVEARHEMWT